MVKVKKDLTGMRFGRLVVLKQSENDYVKPDGRREARWICQCDCGNTTEPIGTKLKNGATQSCGCLQQEVRVQSGLNTKNLIHNTRKINIYDLSGEYGIGYAAQGEEFYFDLEDYDLIKDHYWYVDPRGYLICSEKIFMHVLIMSPYEGEYVDHIKHNTLDNRKSKLRLVTPSQNCMNRGLQRNNTSGITGVSFHKASQRWFAYTKLNSKQKRVYADSKEEAIKIRKRMEEKYFGEYSYDNSMKGA